MKVVTDFAEARALGSGEVGLVPTLGFLHEGHLSLLTAAREACDTVVMSHFVNPLQFDEPGDLIRYPRDLERDLALAEAKGTDVVFAPTEPVMYPPGPLVQVTVPDMSKTMEGAHRPGHFVGMATVVAKLLVGLRADRAYFGRKDAQQLAIVRRMVEDLAIPTRIEARPTIREPDGLALSSRNVFVAAADRPAALALSEGLLAAADLAEGGVRESAALADVVIAACSAAPGVEVEYVAVASATDVAAVSSVDRDCFLAGAIRLGGVRLIDNIHFAVDDEIIADRGVRLSDASLLYDNDST